MSNVPMFVSYAQNFEDVILHRALKDVTRGFYIDIAPQDPVVDSVSLAFYEQGWRGVHVEPNRFYSAKFRDARPDETVVTAAIAARGGSIPLFEVAETGLSTADEAMANRHIEAGFAVERTETPCIPLSDLLDAYRDREIHWLKIDVEGLEQRVIESWSPSLVRPWVVLVKSTKPQSQAASHSDWDDTLVTLGYQFAYFDGVNRFYVNDSHSKIMKYFGHGPNIFDDFVVSQTTYVARYLHKVIENQAASLFARGLEIEHLRAARALDIEHLRAFHATEVRRLQGELEKFERSIGGRLTIFLGWLGGYLRIPGGVLMRTFARVGFHASGRPRRWVRRMAFHSSGKPRRFLGVFAMRNDGTPRRAFAPWMASAEYLNLRDAVKPTGGRLANGRDENEVTPRERYFLTRLLAGRRVDETASHQKSWSARIAHFN